MHWHLLWIENQDLKVRRIFVQKGKNLARFRGGASNFELIQRSLRLVAFGGKRKRAQINQLSD